MKKILIDTDVLIDFTKGHDESLATYLELQKKKQTELYINPVIVTEFMTDENMEDEKKYGKALQFLDLFQIVDISKKTGLIAGKLMRKKQLVYLGDALIASTALEHNLELATRNKKHFKKVSGLTLLS